MTGQHTPRSLIVTFYGAYGRGDAGRPAGPVPIAALIRLLGAVGVDAPSVRSAVSRLKRRGLLVADRTDAGAAGYALSQDARQLLDDGDRRIYGRPGAGDGTGEAAGGWLLAVFSVPEQERHKRHLLRSRLARLGFGTAAPGVWIAPDHLYDETRHTLARLELGSYVDLFRGAHADFEPTEQAVRRWWDLEQLAKLHHAFLDAQEPVLGRWADGAAPDHGTPATPARGDAYRDYVLALDSWRFLPYADPGLPPALLPPHWPGVRAAKVFAALHDRLYDAGAAHVRAVLSATRA
ncbi:PaaX family transcriptional regulator C-terminal domain-containing protein [Streptomyces sp. ME19-01-6]|uniref:PaaX family transcriptional regulator n=1 Tax=Streptomyces sp. ME19-01-6 TaxID=3028686 RepID=UPI0029A9A981|nr:PaaX family transcriptional regulator C-terminal domain-containing protein [Streptomyces sp. ME19-01-6]MDX3230137.1 PaaX family transcriptional regulator C-terminal domain-containing protein [Streptomyces sp. ME19-01-6]